MQIAIHAMSLYYTHNSSSSYFPETCLMSIALFNATADRTSGQPFLLLLLSTSRSPELPPLGHERLGPFLDLGVLEMRDGAREEGMKSLDVLGYEWLVPVGDFGVRYMRHVHRSYSTA